MAKAHGREADWAEAKRLCRLSAEDVRMAKELGFNPRKLMKNIPSPSQHWKAPVKVWVRDLYLAEQEKSRARAARIESVPGEEPAAGATAARAPLPAPPWTELDELPYAAEPRYEWDEPRSLAEEIEETNRQMLKRQRDFRQAADYVAHGIASISGVQRIVLFGSVAAPLVEEVPRFTRLRRAGAKVWRECRDVDLAVWLGDCGSLKALQKAQGRALNDLLDDRDVGVAHHQLDIHFLEPGSNRHLGQLCHYGACPKGKPACRVPGCGQLLFLQRFEGYVFEPVRMASQPTLTLFDRPARIGPPEIGPDDAGRDDSGPSYSDPNDDDLPF